MLAIQIIWYFKNTTRSFQGYIRSYYLGYIKLIIKQISHSSNAIDCIAKLSW